MHVGLVYLSELPPHGEPSIEFREGHLLKEALRERGAKPVDVDLAAYPGGPPTTVDDAGTLTLDGTTIEPDDLASAIVCPQFLFKFVHCKGFDEFAENPLATLSQLREHRGLFEGWLTMLADAGVRLTVPPNAFPTHQRKLWQMHRLARHDVPVPKSVVTTDPAAVTEFVEKHGRAVAKPVSGGFVPEVITPEELTDERLAIVEETPLQLQTFAPGEDLRAYVVGDSYVGAMQYSYTDERFSFKSTEADEEVDFLEHDASDELQEIVETAADVIDISFAAVDIRYEPETGETHVVEVNPGGRFAGAHEAGLDIAGRLADWLVGE